MFALIDLPFLRVQRGNDFMYFYIFVIFRPFNCLGVSIKILPLMIYFSTTVNFIGTQWSASYLK